MSEWKDVPSKVLLKALSYCDGWTVFEPQMFVKLGIPADLVESVTATHESDGTVKGSLFDNRHSGVYASLRGVYGLDMLKSVAAALDVQYEERMGRGFQAQAIMVALHDFLEHRP